MAYCALELPIGKERRVLDNLSGYFYNVEISPREKHDCTSITLYHGGETGVSAVHMTFSGHGHPDKDVLYLTGKTEDVKKFRDSLEKIIRFELEFSHGDDAFRRPDSTERRKK